MSIPKPKVFWPLTIDASNHSVYFKRSGVDYTGTIASGTYYSASLLVDAVVAAMNAVDGGNVYTNAGASSGLISISASFAWNFRWGAFIAASAYSLLGWNAVDTAAATTQTAPRQHANGWYSPTAVLEDSREFFEQPNSVVTVSIGGQTKAITEGELTLRAVTFAYLDEARTFVANQGSGGNDPTAIENWWRNGRGRFRYWPDGSVEGTSTDYVLDGSALSDGFKPERMTRSKAIWKVGPWKFRRYVA